MQKLIGILFINFIFLNAETQQKNLLSTQSQLESYAGSYKLIKGKQSVCPEGEFGAKDNAFVVGADFRISGINKPRTTELLDRISACKLQRQASYDGKYLKYITKESCPKAADLIKEHILEFNKTETEQSVKLQFYKKHKVGNSYRSNLEYECLYSIELKQKK